MKKQDVFISTKVDDIFFGSRSGMKKPVMTRVEMRSKKKKRRSSKDEMMRMIDVEFIVNSVGDLNFDFTPTDSDWFVFVYVWV
jgi:hypothetical protein